MPTHTGEQGYKETPQHDGIYNNKWTSKVKERHFQVPSNLHRSSLDLTDKCVPIAPVGPIDTWDQTGVDGWWDTCPNTNPASEVCTAWTTPGQSRHARRSIHSAVIESAAPVIQQRLRRRLVLSAWATGACRRTECYISDTALLQALYRRRLSER